MSATEDKTTLQVFSHVCLFSASTFEHFCARFGARSVFCVCICSCACSVLCALSPLPTVCVFLFVSSAFWWSQLHNIPLYCCEQQQIVKLVSYCDDCSINLSAHRVFFRAAHCSLSRRRAALVARRTLYHCCVLIRASEHMTSSDVLPPTQTVCLCW